MRYFGAAIAILLIAWAHGASAQTTPTWTTHASVPGPDRDHRGNSRFEQLFATDGGFHIPYPLEALIASLEARLDRDSGAALQQVLVPIGRSLHRHSPAPDYFHHPRQLISVSREPAVTPGRAGLVLEYRLFIAHQPDRQLLEIISYNDEAGRFEFQVVEDYADNRQPRLRQANRAMCLSCHQNAGPIFPRSPWSETNTSYEIAQRLIEARGSDDYNLVNMVTADANIMDLLIDRANYLSAVQTIWQQGCATAECRLALFRAALQYRLSDESGFDNEHRDYRLNYKAALADRWRTRWPHGLALPDAHLPDIDPLSPDPPPLVADPLMPRAPHARWARADAVFADGIATRLAGFISLRDATRIDRYLVANAASRGVASRRYHAKCRLHSQAANHHFECGNPVATDSLRASIEIEGWQSEAEIARVLRLQLPNSARIMQPRIENPRLRQNRLTFSVGKTVSGLSARLFNGDRIESMTLAYDRLAGVGDVSLIVEVRRDFELVDAALGELLARQDGNRFDSLSMAPFRRQAVISELTRVLGMEPLHWVKPLPAPEALGLTQSAALKGSLSLLNTHCGRCHAENSHNPPGFLHGSNTESKVRRCAPRILARLNAWRSGDLAPMPPPASLPAGETTEPTWIGSRDYRNLLTAMQKLAEATAGGSRQDDLPDCHGKGD